MKKGRKPQWSRWIAGILVFVMVVSLCSTVFAVPENAVGLVDEDTKENLQTKEADVIEEADVVEEAETVEEPEEIVPVGIGEGEYNLELKWDTDNADNWYNWIERTLSQDKITLKYALTFSTSGIAYNPGEVVIRIPRALFVLRNGTALLPTDIGIPEKSTPNKDRAFTYEIDTKGTTQEDDDELVITNWQTLDAAFNQSFQVSYIISPTQVADMTQAIMTAVVTTTSNGQESSKQAVIKYTLDTGMEGVHVGKAARDRMYTWDPTYVLDAPIPDDFDQRNYVVYTISARANFANQPVKFEFVDKPGQGGRVEVVRGASNKKITPVENNSWTITTSGFSQGSKGLDLGNYYVITSYPKSASTTQYSNDVELTATAADVHEVPDGLEDFYESETANSSASTQWENYIFPYHGNKVDFFKGSNLGDTKTTRSGMIAAFRAGSDWNRTYTLTAKAGGYEEPYNLSLLDDALYWYINSETPIKMTDDDYEFTGVNLRVYQLTEYDRNNGEQSTPATDGKTINILGQKAGTTNWEQIDQISLALALTKSMSISIPADSDYVKLKIDLPAGIKDYLYIYAAPQVRFKVTSVQLQEWLQENGDIKQLTILNVAGVQMISTETGELLNQNANATGTSTNYIRSLGVFDEDQTLYGWELQRDLDKDILTELGWTSNALKQTISTVNDPQNSRVNINYGLLSYQGMVVNDSSLQTVLYDGIKNGDMKAPCDEEAVYYDLLPQGQFFNPDGELRVYGATGYTGQTGAQAKNARIQKADVDIETIDNYRGTGRQLVIFRLKSLEAPGENWAFGALGVTSSDTLRVNWGLSGDFLTGFSVYFTASVRWDDLAFSKSGYNLMAYQPQGGIKANADTEVGYPTSAYTSIFKSVVGDDGQPAFYDINGNGDPTDTVCYALSEVKIDVATSVQSGIKKTVRTGNNLYAESAEAWVDDSYSYRLYMGNSTEGTVEGVILYDILESAGDEAGWQGEYDGIDCTIPKQQGIKPVVYYSTEKGLSYNQPADLDLASAKWTTVEPVNRQDITAIAVDLSENDRGEDYIFQPEQSTAITILMKAPATTTANPWTYNQPAYHSIFKIKNSPNQTEATNIGDPVSVKLNEQSGPLKISKTVDGDYANTSKEFTFTLSLKDTNGESLAGVFPYTGDAMGTIGDGDSITLKDGQQIVIEDIPGGSQYKVEESPVSGYTADEEEKTGIIRKIGETAAFVNTYGLEKTDLTLYARKELAGNMQLTDQMFTFQIKEEGKVVATGSNKADGSITFSKIIYTKPGTHDYIVTEIDGGLADITYDKTSYHISVTVEDNGDGTLSTVVKYPEEEIVFHNSFDPVVPVYPVTPPMPVEPGEASIVLSGQKKLKNGVLQKDQFVFIATEDGEIVSQGKNDESGAIVFSPIIYHKAGVHTYQIYERDDGEKSIKYDKTVYQAVVTVTENASGKLTAMVAYDGQVIFKNTQTNVFDEMDQDSKKSDPQDPPDRDLTIVTITPAGSKSVKPAIKEKAVGSAMQQPVTGDNSPIWWYLFLAVGMISVVTYLLWKMKHRK